MNLLGRGKVGMGVCTCSASLNTSCLSRAQSLQRCGAAGEHLQRGSESAGVSEVEKESALVISDPLHPYIFGGLFASYFGL